MRGWGADAGTDSPAPLQESRRGEENLGCQQKVPIKFPYPLPNIGGVTETL